MRLGEMAGLLDFVNLMAYDFSGSWDQKAGHQANLFHSQQDPGCTPFSADKAVKDYISYGIPAEKIVLGMPLYGRAFCNTSGPGHHYQGNGEGSWEAGIWDYKVWERFNPRSQDRTTRIYLYTAIMLIVR
jgi:chitinase